MITLADQPLLLEDPRGDVRRFLTTFQALRDGREFAGMPAALRSPKLVGKGRTLGPGIAPINYPQSIRPQLNTLYWPTGATRWAQGLFLCHQSQIAALLAAAANGAITLQMGDESQFVVTTNVYVLPPRPVTAGDSEFELYLVPIVDERYWWQFIDADDLEVNATTTWETLLETISARINAVTGSNVVFRVDDMVNADYLQPDPTEFSRPFENVAVLLDAVAASLGRRVVRGLDGSIFVDSPAAATTIWSSNVDGERWTAVAGGDFQSVPSQPEQVLVTFRQRPSESRIGCVDSFWTAANPATGTATVGGTRRTFHSAAYATYQCGGEEPDNAAKLNALAARLTLDVASWGSKQYDHTFNGLLNWTPCGFDNGVIWTFGRDVGSGNETVRMTSHTRVQSMPSDVFSETQLSQDPCALRTTTTTTAAPLVSTTTTEFPPCYGQCKWVWSGSGYWSQVTDGCSPTTTTTANVSTSSTSSTADPCACSTTTVSPTTTTSSGTTTTTKSPCQCIYPTYCGTTPGECTYTFCGSGYSTASSACSPSTTTTCDCSSTTTTTPAPGTTPGGTWIAVPDGNGGWQWQLVSGSCPDGTVCNPPTTAPYACASGSGSGGSGGGGDGGGGGDCVYYWIPSLNQWVLFSSGCTGEAACTPPSGDGSICAPVSTPCQTKTTPDPCASCNGTSTTTANPCGTQAIYKCDGTNWNLQSNGCASGCDSQPPAIACMDTCQTAASPCVPATSTTTSTTTTSTTTTTAAPTGACCYGGGPSCSDPLTQAECEALPAYVSWSAGQSCIDINSCSPTTTTAAPTTTTGGATTTTDSGTTTTGSGTTTTAGPTTTTTQVLGACCLGTGTCDETLLESACTALGLLFGGSTWHGNQSCTSCTTTTAAPTTTTTPDCSGDCHLQCTDTSGVGSGPYQWIGTDCFSPCGCTTDGDPGPCNSSNVGATQTGTCNPP